MPVSSDNIYLIGFMGTGKSTIGRQLADTMKLEFLDSDECIEKKEGISIPEIFENKGEAYFRSLEKNFIEQGHPRSGCVVSCGGGLVTQPGMLAALKKRGKVVALCATPETIYERTRYNSNRPLLRVDNPLQTIRELLEKRRPFYAQADMSILTDNRPIHEIIQHISRACQ